MITCDAMKMIMEMVESNPNVLFITESNGVLDMLKKMMAMKQK